MLPRIHSLRGCAALVLAAGALSAAPPSMERFVGEDADLYLRVRSIPELRDSWDGHPLQQVWESPAMQQALEAWMSDLNEPGEPSPATVLDEEFGLTPEELLDLFSGEVGFYVSGMGAAMVGGSAPAIAMVADYGGEPERLHELLDIQFERNASQHRERNPEARHNIVEERFMGETLYFDEVFDGEETYIEDGYALVDGKFVLATPEEQLRVVVERIKEGADRPLAEKDGFVALRDADARGDLMVFVDLETLMPPLLEALREQLDDPSMAALGVTPDALMSALGLDAFRGVMVAVDLDPERLAVSSGFGFEGEDGLAGLLAYRDGPLPEPRFVPREPISAGSALFDISAALASLERTVNLISPFYGTVLDTQLKSAGEASGVDLRRALIENFGSEIVSFSIFDPAAGGRPTVDDIGQVFAVEVRDAESLEAALETLKDLAPGLEGQFEETEVEGTRIYTLPGSLEAGTAGGQAQDFCYAVTRSRLFVCTGRVSMLREALTRAAGDGDGFWERRDMSDAFDALSRPRKVGRSYTDVEAFYASMISTVADAFRELRATGMMDVDPGFFPAELEVPFIVVSESNRIDGGIVARAHLLPKQGTVGPGEEGD